MQLNNHIISVLRSQVKTMKEEKAELKADRDRQQEEVTRMRKVIGRTDAERQTERDRQEDEVNRLTDEIKRMQQEINRQHAVIHKGDGGGDGGFAGAGRDGEIVLGGGGGGEVMVKNGDGSRTQSMPNQERPIANNIDHSCSIINNVIPTKIMGKHLPNAFCGTAGYCIYNTSPSFCRSSCLAHSTL